VETLAELREHMQTIITEIGDSFTEPDDDWLHVACFDGEDGLVIAGLANDLFANGFRKDVLAHVLKQAMVQFKARRYAVLFNAHMKRMASDEELERIRDEETRVEHLDGAQECLMLVVGDAEQEEGWIAHIERDGVNPPTLGTWELTDGFGGRFARLNEQMRAIRA